MLTQQQIRKMFQHFEVENFFDQVNEIVWKEIFEDSSEEKLNELRRNVIKAFELERLFEAFQRQGQQLLQRPNFNSYNIEKTQGLRFNFAVGMAILITLRDIENLPEIAPENCLTKFGKKDLPEFLSYLSELGFGNELSVKKIKGEDVQSENFFHHFLLKLGEIQNGIEPVFKTIEISTKNPLDRFENSDFQEYPGKFSEFFIRQSEKFADDFCEKILIGNVVLNCSETIGARDRQEDTFFVGVSKILDSRTAPKQLQNHFQKLTNDIERNKLDSGSTSVVVNCSQDQILTVASCGDSRATLFFVNPDSSVEAFDLTQDHKLEIMFERARIECEGEGNVVEDPRSKILRITTKQNIQNKSALNMSRSLGDLSFGKVISKEPDIFSYNLAEMLQKRNASFGGESRAILMVCCDGLYIPISNGKATVVDFENCSYAKVLEGFLKDSVKQKIWKGNLSKYLQDYAIAMRSSDNITVVTCDITQPLSKDILINVNDGHGGREVAKFVAHETAKSLGNLEEKFLASKDLNSPSPSPVAVVRSLEQGSLNSKELEESDLPAQSLAVEFFTTLTDWVKQCCGIGQNDSEVEEKSKSKKLDFSGAAENLAHLRKKAGDKKSR